MVWQIQQAKNQLSEVIDRALKDGPQAISRRGKPIAMVVSLEEWKKRTRPATTLVDFFRRSPLAKASAELDLERSTDTGRELDL